jgi:hypothetical protein
MIDLLVLELLEHGNNVFVVAVVDDELCSTSIHLLTHDVRQAVEYARTCHLCLIEGEQMLVMGFILGEPCEPVEVHIPRPELVLIEAGQ